MAFESCSSLFNPGERSRPWDLLLASTQDALVVIDDQGYCLGASASAITMLSLASETLSSVWIGNLFTDLESWTQFQSQMQTQGSLQWILTCSRGQTPLRITVTSGSGACQYLLLVQEMPEKDSPVPVSTSSRPCEALSPRQVERVLRQSESRLRAIFEQAAVGINQTDTSGRFLRANQRFCDLLGYSQADLLTMTRQQVIHPDDLERDQAALQEMFSGRMQAFAQEQRYLSRQGESIWTRVTFSCIQDEQGELSGLAIVEDITERKQMGQELLNQIEREILLNTIVKDIRESLDLDQILQRTAQSIQTFFHGSRGIVALCAEPDQVLVHRMAAAAPGFDSTQGLQIPIVGNLFVEAVFAQEETVAVADVNQDPLMVSVLPLMTGLEIRAMLAVSIRIQERVRGLLCVHQCHTPRQWTSDEKRLLRQIADHLALAIHHSELYHQVQVFNVDLEQQVVARTYQLRQALEFEATLRRITDQVRDGLDEQWILQTVVRDLGQALRGNQCLISLFSSNHQTATLQCEFTQEAIESVPNSVGLEIAEYTDLYTPLLQGQMLQFCAQTLPFHPAGALVQGESVLVCPIRDDQEILGDIWITRPPLIPFSDLETRLVQQVANQCGIAIRQSRLYDAAQKQVHELERLNHLKDDFISTISHELRTPLTNLRLALRLLNQNESLDKQQLYYEMAVNECERQIALITDLLNLQRLTANRYELRLEPLHLLPWLQEMIEPYYQIARSQEKALEFAPTALEDVHLTTDRNSLTRILQELLTNACKYTSPGDLIQVGAGGKSDPGDPDGWVWIEVANQGELGSEDLARVFEKFYRVPQSDRWKHAGTGLGLALVERLVEQLRGQITVVSESEWIRFRLELPRITPA